MFFRRLPLVADGVGIIGQPMPGRHVSLGQAAKEMEDVQSRAARPLREPNRIVETLPAVTATCHANGQRASVDESLQPAPDVARL